MQNSKPTAGAAWLEAWKTWVDLAGSGTAPAAGQTSGAVGALGAAYLAFAKSVQELLQEGGTAGFAERLVAVLKAGAEPLADERAAALYAFINAAPSMLTARVLAARRSGVEQRVLDTLAAWSKEFLDLPAVGPQREWQEALKRVQRAWLVQERSARTLAAHYEAATSVALERFAAYLKDDGGTPITSVRALYDAWVEQAETAYAERCKSRDFSRDFAAWVNAGSGTRTAARALLERIAGVLDMPQRAEINALLERQRRMQLEIEHLRAELARANATRADDLPTPPPARTGERPAAPRARRMPSAPASAARKKAVREAKPRSKRAAREFDIDRILAASD